MLERKAGSIRDVVEREDDPLHPGVEQWRELLQQRIAIAPASVVDVEPGGQRESETGALAGRVLRERTEL